MVNPYVIPVLTALIIKLFLVFFAKRKGTKSEYLFGLIAAFILQNIAELAMFIQFDLNLSSGTFMRVYYVSAIAACCYGSYYVLQISRPQISLKVLHYTLTPLCVILVALILSTNSIISGSESIGYTVTATIGEHYWYFRVVMMGTLAFVLFNLITGYRENHSQELQVKCSYAMFAFLPIVLTSGVVILIMAAGYKANAAAIFPLATTAFIFILVLSEGRHRLTDVRRFIPLSVENQLSGNTQDLIGAYAQEDITHKELINELEKLAVMYKLEKKSGNVEQTASSMGVPRSTLYSIIKSHDVDLSNFRTKS